MKLKFIIAGILGVCNGFMANAKDPDITSGVQQKVSTTRVPFHFVENVGQIKDQYGNIRVDIDAQLSDRYVNVFVGSGNLHYQWYQPGIVDTFIDYARGGQKRVYLKEWNTYRVDLTLQGANPAAQLIKEKKVAYKQYHYGPGIPEAGYKAAVYDKLVYKNIYPQIDWVIYVNDNGLEYDFIVHPGGRIEDIRMSYSGADAVVLGSDGKLLVKSPYGSITEQAPHTYLEDGTVVASHFIQKGDHFSFATAPYQGRLIIDPKVHWGTYVGGDFFFDEVEGVYADGKGSVYALGRTTSGTNIATAGAFQATIQGFDDAMLLKFDEKGVIQWGTYYGGVGRDDGGDISVDSAGNLIITIRTDAATGMATTGTHQTTSGGGEDVLLAKFDTSGQRIWATYYGGSEMDGAGRGLEVYKDAIYVGGSTFSGDQIATPGSFIPNKLGSAIDLDRFLAKFDQNGQRIWSTYVATNENDYGGPIAIDSKGYVYFCGFTYRGTGLGTPGSHQPNVNLNNPASPYDAFLIKFDESGKRIWGTYYGGEGDDGSLGIVCDDQDNVYMSGTTRSTTGIATAGSYQPAFSNGAEDDHYIVKFNGAGQRQWATYYGGSGYEGNSDLVIMNKEHLLLIGTTSSTTGIATAGAIQPNFSGERDMYIAQFTLDGAREWATYYGGPGIEHHYSTFADRGNLYLTAETTSPSGVATPGSFMPNYPNPLIHSGLLVKLCFAQIGNDLQGNDSVCAGSAQSYSVPDLDDVDAYLWTLPEGWSGSGNSRSVDVLAGETSGDIQVQIVRCGDTSNIVLLPVYVFPKEIPVITVNGYELGVSGNFERYQWLLNGTAINGADKASYTVKENGEYRVAVWSQHGCMDTSDVYRVNNVSVKDLSQQRLHIYPNPARHVLYTGSHRSVEAVITSIEGKILWKQQVVGEIPVADFASGVYLLTLKDAEGNIVCNTKWVKM